MADLADTVGARLLSAARAFLNRAVVSGKFTLVIEVHVRGDVLQIILPVVVVVVRRGEVGTVGRLARTGRSNGLRSLALHGWAKPKLTQRSFPPFLGNFAERVLSGAAVFDFVISMRGPKRPRGPVERAKLRASLAAVKEKLRNEAHRAALVAQEYGRTMAQRLLRRGRGYVQYHLKKLRNPFAHPYRHGGLRWTKYSPYQKQLMEFSLFMIATNDDTRTLGYYTVCNLF